MNIKIIGLGGIGSILSEKICRFINYSKKINADITLIDGDHYELKNYERQDFSMIGNKAIVKEHELRMSFEELNINSIEQYVNNDNISQIIQNKDIVLLGVDNHKTRQIVSNYCKTLNEIIIISGGNDFIDGNVQIYIRKGGHDITPSLCDYHPEIRNPVDKHPDDMSCEELSQSEPQLFFTNLGVATIMCWVFYNVIVKKNYRYSEVYFDILTMKADSKERAVQTTNERI